MLESLLHHKKEEKNYLVSLVVTDEQIEAALYESTAGRIKVLKTAGSRYSGDWEKGIAAGDKAVSELETVLPEGAALKNVVFGLFPHWLTEDKIKDQYLKNLKKLTSSLALTPLGYVELPIAVAHQLQKDEGTLQTVILVGAETGLFTVSIFKIGKLIGNIEQKRSDPPDGGVAEDLDKALTAFTEVEVLPSRILLYGPVTDLEQVKTELLNYPWQKKANFLHLPKIEILPADFAVRAVASASASEIVPQPEEVKEVADEAGKETAVVKEPAKPGTSGEVTAIAKDLGFTDEETEMAESQEKVEIEAETAVSGQEYGEDLDNIAPVKQGLKFKPPKFKLPHFSISFKIPRFNKFGVWGILIGLGLILFIGYSASFWFLPKAQVKILVSSQKFDRAVDIAIDTKISEVDTEKQILPAKEVTGSVTGSFTVTTTGKKTIGDKAKGEVTIYNKTLNLKNFKAGQGLTSGNLKFTLDGDTSVASASESVGSLTYGTTKAQITAVIIGETSNLGPGSEFVFTDLPATSYSGRNEKALAGGTSREVAVVTRGDHQQAREKAQTELKTKAEQEMLQKLSGDEKLLDNASTLKIIEENFSHEIGAETDELSLEMNLSVVSISYNAKDMAALIDKVISSNLPENYEYKADAKITVDEVVGEKEERMFKYRIIANLVPRLEINDIARQLRGKSVKDATDFFRNKNYISGVQINVDAPFAFLKNTLPRDPAKITLVVEAL